MVFEAVLKTTLVDRPFSSATKDTADRGGKMSASDTYVDLYDDIDGGVTVTSHLQHLNANRWKDSGSTTPKTEHVAKMVSS